MSQINRGSGVVTPSCSSHQFRIFKRSGERRAFRLERTFWAVLERAAKQQEKRIGDLVFDIIYQSEDANNLSSVLRGYALSWLDEQARVHSVKLVSEAAFVVFNTSPSAGFIFDENRHVISYNKAMIGFMNQCAGSSSVEIREVRLSFELTIPSIFEIIGNKSGKVVECGFRFVFSGKTVAERARISQLVTLPHEPRRLLAFVL
ncbi:MAG: ribbon-helix-helix domain-containing protein [Alphaproteobacteria bacterium]|nr:ribbon-helix-helix domain-containing protein [Alphaproteobacteria bacterium]